MEYRKAKSAGGKLSTETVILLFQLGCAAILLRTLWLIHAPLALALTALLKASARWLDGTGKREADVLARLERER